MDVLTWLALDVCTDFRVVESLGRLRERLKFKPCTPSFPYFGFADSDHLNLYLGSSGVQFNTNCKEHLISKVL